MAKYIVTIARQFGSMGRPIAQKLSEILSIEYYDRDIVEMTAKKMNLPVSTLSKVEEKIQGSSLFNMQFPLGTDSLEIQKKIFETQRNIIMDLAHHDSCIFVGRCSDAILQEQNAIHFYIYAPYEFRLKNCIELLGMQEAEAVKMIKTVDRAREQYHKRYSGYTSSDPDHKSLMIDSSVLGIDGTAELLAECITKWNFYRTERISEK